MVKVASVKLTVAILSLGRTLYKVGSEDESSDVFITIRSEALKSPVVGMAPLITPVTVATPEITTKEDAILTTLPEIGSSDFPKSEY